MKYIICLDGTTILNCDKVINYYSGTNGVSYTTIDGQMSCGYDKKIVNCGEHNAKIVLNEILAFLTDDDKKVFNAVAFLEELQKNK